METKELNGNRWVRAVADGLGESERCNLGMTGVMLRPASPEVAPTSELPVRSDIDTLFEGWDRAAFGIDMRRIEILLLHRDIDRARQVFESMARRQRRDQLTMASHVGEAFDVRMANMLEKAGYATLQAVHHADDTSLRRLPNMGSKQLERCRDVVKAVLKGKPLPAEDLSDLFPEWSIDSLFHQKVDAVSDRITQALETLETADESAVAEIDRRITELKQQIAKLERVRKLIKPRATTGSTPQGIDELGKQIRKLVTAEGAMPMADLAGRLKQDVKYIGRIVARCDYLTKRHDGFVVVGG